MDLKRVAISIPFNRNILAGIGLYLTTHRRWRIDWIDQWSMEVDTGQWTQWPGDGAIIQMLSHNVLERTAGGKRPVVNVADNSWPDDIPTVQNDNAAIGQLGAEHFLERGFRQLAFCGDMRFDYAQMRWEAFRDAGEQADAEVVLLKSVYGGALSQDPQREELARQLARLARPVGVMCSNDSQAHLVARVCLEAELLVPEQVAILGVDNDQLACNLDLVPLSSVIPDMQQIGYEAAAMLDKLLAGQSPQPRQVLIAPAGIAERRSTEVMAINDKDVVQTLNTIRTRLAEDVNPAQLAKAVGLSRRSLDRKFMLAIRRTVAEEIMLKRLQLARKLLRQTRLQMTEVAEKSGFTSINHFGQCFRRRYGKPPSDYRKQFAES